MKLNFPRCFVLVFLVYYNSLSVFSQEIDSTISSQPEIVLGCEQEDIKDLFGKKDKTDKPSKKRMLLILPNIASNPTNGLLIGVGGVYAKYFGPQQTTRVSTIGFTAAITSKQQVLTFIKSNIFTPNDKFFLQGDWRYYIYNTPTWGLGTNAPDTISLDNQWVWNYAKTGESEGAYNMAYNYIKIHETINYSVRTNYYIGIGYHLDSFSKIKDELLNLDTLPAQLTPHYIYSKAHNFDETAYKLSGLSINFIYDSRDNLINPYKGQYININYRYNPTFLGSNQNSSSLMLEYRTYISLSKRSARHILGFWAMGKFLLTGSQPYLTLMANGEDPKARSGRAYIAGRYRGENFLYGEIEYRFPLSKCSQIIGGVVFVNATTSTNSLQNVHLFDYVRPGVGLGLRIMINKKFRTNISLDYGTGHNSNGFYFSGTETF